MPSTPTRHPAAVAAPPAAQRLRAGLRGMLRMARVGWLIGHGVLVVAAVFPRLDAPRRHARIGLWARAVLAALGVDLRLQGHVGPGAQLLVANHVSWLDVVVLLALVPQARFVSKAEVRRWPLVGRLAAGAGTFFLQRERPRQAAAAVEAITATLAAGGNVAFFPEGTTSDGHDVLPFRASLLQAAHAAGVPVQPLALRYADARHRVSPSVPYVDDDSFVGSLWRAARADSLVAQVRALEAHDPCGRHRRTLAVELRAAIRAALP